MYPQMYMETYKPTYMFNTNIHLLGHSNCTDTNMPEMRSAMHVSISYKHIHAHADTHE